MSKERLISKNVTLSKDHVNLINEHDGINFSDKLRRILDEYKK